MYQKEYIFKTFCFSRREIYMGIDFFNRVAKISAYHSYALQEQIQYVQHKSFP